MSTEAFVFVVVLNVSVALLVISSTQLLLRRNTKPEKNVTEERDGQTR